MGAGFFTNPIDVVKIRLQLQGELEARGTYEKFYKNTFHAGYVIAKNEGILALQSALGSALAFQVVLNGIRLGSYKIGRTYGFTLNDKGETDILRTAVLSGVSGCIGAVLGSPFYLVRMLWPISLLQTLKFSHKLDLLCTNIDKNFMAHICGRIRDANTYLNSEVACYFYSNDEILIKQLTFFFFV